MIEFYQAIYRNRAESPDFTPLEPKDSNQNEEMGLISRIWKAVCKIFESIFGSSNSNTTNEPSSHNERMAASSTQNSESTPAPQKATSDKPLKKNHDGSGDDDSQLTKEKVENMEAAFATNEPASHNDGILTPSRQDLESTTALQGANLDIPLEEGLVDDDDDFDDDTHLATERRHNIEAALDSINRIRARGITSPYDQEVLNHAIHEYNTLVKGS